jgi:hypothetical protein
LTTWTELELDYLNWNIDWSFLAFTLNLKYWLFLGLETISFWTGIYTIRFPGSQASGYGTVLDWNQLPWSPAYWLQILGLLSLHDYQSQILTSLSIYLFTYLSHYWFCFFLFLWRTLTIYFPSCKTTIRPVAHVFLLFLLPPDQPWCLPWGSSWKLWATNYLWITKIWWGGGEAWLDACLFVCFKTGYSPGWLPTHYGAQAP